MHHSPLLSMLNEAFDHLFVVDKRGKTIFYPWGSNKPGYFIKSNSTIAKAKKFYRTSFSICFVFLGIAVAFFHDFWMIIGSMIFFLGGWYLIYYVYTANIIKRLLPARTSYKDVVLEKLEPDDDEEASDADEKFPVHSDKPVPFTQGKSVPFARIMSIWYRLSPGQIFLICFFISLFSGILWSTYRPEEWINADNIVGFLLCFLFGYGGFIVTQQMGPAKEDWFAFFQWKLSMIVMVVASWSSAAWFLYKLVVLILSNT